MSLVFLDFFTGSPSRLVFWYQILQHLGILGELLSSVSRLCVCVACGRALTRTLEPQQLIPGVFRGTSPLFRSLKIKKGAEGLRNTTDKEQKKMNFIHRGFNYFREARALVTCVFVVITVNRKQNE